MSSDIEIIIVDDGSTDESGKICDEYANRDRGITVIHKKNEGVSIARNIGIENACGKWISFVDSDDYVSSCYIPFFHSIQNTSYDLVFFSFILHSNESEIKKSMPDKSYEGHEAVQNGFFDLMRNDQDFEFAGYVANKFFRKSILDNYNIRFINGQYYREDELFTLEYLRHVHSFRTSSPALYCYRINLDGCLTNQKKDPNQVFRYTDVLLDNIVFFTNPSVRAMEYDRALHVLINTYSPDLSKQEKMGINDRIRSLIKEHSNELIHLKKTRFYSLVYSLPECLSFPVMEMVFKRAYLHNTNH